MEFNGKKLILDNFRGELKGYPIDVQDIVRSAILDGLDISEYIQACKGNPSRLEQIRLCKKEGVDESYLSTPSGELLYRMRTLGKKGVNLQPIKKYLTMTPSLGEVYISYVLDWYEDGITFDYLNLSIIPEMLLSVFDLGLRNGVNMKIFNNGKIYTTQYLLSCVQIYNNGHNVDSFLKDDWDSDTLQAITTFSKTTKSKFKQLISLVTRKDSSDRVVKYIEAVRLSRDLVVELKGIEEDERINLVIDAFKNNLDFKKVANKELTLAEARSLYSDLYLEKTKIRSGKFK